VNRVGTLLSSALCLLAFWNPQAWSFPQEPISVVISGTVEDENRLPVSGVQVTLHLGNRNERVTTNQLGRFRFEGIEAGNHRLDFDKPGFFRLRDYEVRSTPPSKEVTVTLVREYEIRSQVDVVASPREVDPGQTDHNDELVAQEIREDPVRSSHSLQNALPAIPGVVQDGNGFIHVAGARDEDTVYVLDGFQMNGPSTGAFDARINVDAVRTVDVMTGRYGAQYSNAPAGVLALQTDNGDDHWRFGTTNFLPSLNFERGIHLDNWFPRATISGPLKKGRAWFSNSLSLQHGFSLVRELPRGADTSDYWAGDNLFRAQYNLSPSHSLQGNFLYNAAVTHRTGLGPFAPESTTIDSHSRRYFVSIKDQIALRNGLLEFGFASDRDRLRRTPQGSETYVITPAGPQGNYFERLEAHSHRWQGRSDLTLTGRRWRGVHTIQIGLNADETRLDQMAERHSVELRKEDSTLARQGIFSGSPNLSVSTWQGGIYAQDSWQLRSSLVLKAGVRLDRNDFVGKVLTQPRVVVNWLPLGSTTKFSAGWGTYYQPVYTSLISASRDQRRLDLLGPGTPTSIETSFSHSSSLRQPYFETASVEWQQQWNLRTLTSVHVMDRRQRHGLAYEDVSADPTRQQFELNGNRSDRYQAVDVSLRHSPKTGADFMIDYTYSRARSNSLFDYSVREFLLAGRVAGPLSWDAPHRVISRGSAQTGIWKLLFSYFFEYHTGFPFSAVNSQYRLQGIPNGYRYPAFLSLNAAAEKRFRFRGNEWAFRLAAINLTGHRNYGAVINNIDAEDFLAFAGGQRRAFTARIRLVGRK
jgi:hypothetical protein